MSELQKEIDELKELLNFFQSTSQNFHKYCDEIEKENKFEFNIRSIYWIFRDYPTAYNIFSYDFIMILTKLKEVDDKIKYHQKIMNNKFNLIIDKFKITKEELYSKIKEEE